MNSYVNLNGSFRNEEEQLIPVNNRAFRYGDGLFETMKSINGKLPLAEYHYQRLFSGMKELAFQQPSNFTAQFISRQITELIQKNNHLKKARIRLMIFRGNGSLYGNEYELPNYLIESAALPDEEALNEKGLSIDIYPKAHKSRDVFSAIKTNNFLPYAMAAIYAKQQFLNDCLVLNTSRRICDATIANVFLIKEKLVSTPAISEGCIAGVMRRYLLENLPSIGYTVSESSITPDQLTEADEVFLSNAVNGIRWVRTCGNLQYTSAETQNIYNKLVKPIFQ